MDILLFILLGLAAGWIASMIMGTNSTQGPMMDIVLGVIGAIVGGFIVRLFGLPGTTGFNLYSLGVAVLGAVALIAIGRAFRRSSRTVDRY